MLTIKIIHEYGFQWAIVKTAMAVDNIIPIIESPIISVHFLPEKLRPALVLFCHL